MSIKTKIKSAKTDGWLAEGLTDEEIKETVKSAKAERQAERRFNRIVWELKEFEIPAFILQFKRTFGLL